MKIYYEKLSDVQRYLDNNKDIGLDEKKTIYTSILRTVRRFKPVDSNTRMIEVGTGTGWFLLLCQLDGLRCKGLEISPPVDSTGERNWGEVQLCPGYPAGQSEGHRPRRGSVRCGDLFKRF
jgi:hypothetical protein